MSTTLPVEVTGGRMRETQPCLVNYTYIPPSDTHTHINTGYSALSLMSTLLQAVLSLHLIFFADLYVEGLTEVSTQSPNAQTQRIGSPLG